MERISYSKAAVAALKRMPSNQREIIVGKIRQYAADPAALANNVSSLKGQRGSKRLRVGDWRVLFTDDDGVVSVYRVAPRGAAYD